LDQAVGVVDVTNAVEGWEGWWTAEQVADELNTDDMKSIWKALGNMTKKGRLAKRAGERGRPAMWKVIRLRIGCREPNWKATSLETALWGWMPPLSSPARTA
jgi:hypothetical protein